MRACKLSWTAAARPVFLVGTVLIACVGTVLADSRTELKPIFGIDYSPSPSDDENTQTSANGVYFAGDLTNTNFASLWGSARTSDGSPGRDDLNFIASTMHGNALRMYNFNPTYNHLSFLDEAAAKGLKIVVPLGNYQVITEGVSNPNQGTSDLITLINESKNKPANKAWGLTNELTNDPTCTSHISQKCLDLLVSACKLIQQHDPSSRPVVITHVDEPGFITPKAVKNALQGAGLGSFYNSRVIVGLNLYFFDQPPATQAISFGGVIDNYFNDGALSSTPLIIGEYGSSAGANTEDQQQQVIADSGKALVAAMKKHPLLLGGFAFEYSDEPWKGMAGGENSYGLRKFLTGRFTTAKTLDGKTYRVDQLQNRPAVSAFQTNAATA